MKISAENLDYQKLNELIRNSDEDVLITDCYGQRYIGAGVKQRTITIDGYPGNGLGSFLDGAEIYINGNVSEAVGDTMNEGKIVINGNAGDALGYSMRGGSILVKGSAGYRTGIHMKQYKEKKPTIVIGETVGSFLGEYLAGGTIVVLNLKDEDVATGFFPCVGMHGGEVFIKVKNKPNNLPKQALCEKATKEQLDSIRYLVEDFAKEFDCDVEEILKETFYVVTPDSHNQYKQMYTNN